MQNFDINAYDVEADVEQNFPKIWQICLLKIWLPHKSTLLLFYWVDNLVPGNPSVLLQWVSV